jgi:MFS family permease
VSRIEASSPQRINWLALFAMGIAVLVIANDFSAINVALPTMEKDFGTDINTIQWVVNAYALTFGVMIVTGGRLADMFGRRNAFFLGTAIFPRCRPWAGWRRPRPG